MSFHDAELAKIDTRAGLINLLVERRPTGVEVVRLDHSAWRFLRVLCDGERIQSAVDKAGELEVSAALAEHLAPGRFITFDLACGRELERAPA